jgi:hypothetical protein
MEELMVGFDAREMSIDFNQTWTDDQKQTFLLRHDIVKPLTVDTMIWKSVFEVSGIELPDYRSLRSDLWSELSKLRHFLKSSAITEPYWLIAITQIGIELEEWLYYRDIVEPVSVDAAWKFLGYDVAEETLLSGICDMGYREDDGAFARQKYAPHLNQYNLFTDREIAADFAKWSDLRDPGHGPFHLYKLYLIDVSNGFN